VLGVPNVGLEGRVGFDPTTPGLKGNDSQSVKPLDSKSGVKPG
jgi:hypothetical protein